MPPEVLPSAMLRALLALTRVEDLRSGITTRQVVCAPFSLG